MKADIERWLREDGEVLLTEVGIKKGQVVLDFGCRSGNYSIPAAKLVGEEGRVFALDKDRAALDELVERASWFELQNIEVMNTSGELEVPLEDASVDVVLVYDVLHIYYFPRAEERRELLHEVHRVLRPEGLVSVRPTHTEKDQIIHEIESASFQLEREYTRTLLDHKKVLEEDQILNFRKKATDRWRCASVGCQRQVGMIQ
jgi:ubiquinone/menaquinone biosynthesis C-methylase UbiE